MGCDIHGVFQVSNEGEWETINSPYNWERDYLLFGFLAGVRERNVYCLGEPRGIPDDFPVFFQHEMPYHILKPEMKYRKLYGENVISMGEHSLGWFTFKEIFEGRQKFIDRQNEIESNYPGYLKFYWYLDYFFNQLEETMQMCGVEDKSRYRMVFGFDS